MRLPKDSEEFTNVATLVAFVASLTGCHHRACMLRTLDRLEQEMIDGEAFEIASVVPLTREVLRAMPVQPGEPEYTRRHAEE